MLKKLKFLLLTSLLCCTMLACNNSKIYSYNFQINESNESIKVTIDSSNGYLLTRNDYGIIIVKDNEPLVNIVFISKDSYLKYKNAVEHNNTCTIRENIENQSLVWQIINDQGKKEYNKILKVEGSETTYAMLGSTQSKEITEEIWNILTFQLNTK